ncbi:MAG TPA: rhodanese-like domain-containing protein [Polyangiaceae bacterium]|nr:rhodanese-like domain-containing protein [Polyangiaceae bacterium]
MIQKLLPWVFLVALLAYFFLKRSGDLSVAQAHELVARGARLVDVRTQEEYSIGHIPGALNIPLHDLSSRLGELRPQEHPVILYCRSGNRSQQAASLLRDAGFTAVHNLGAMSRW